MREQFYHLRKWIYQNVDHEQVADCWKVKQLDNCFDNDLKIKYKDFPKHERRAIREAYYKDAGCTSIFYYNGVGKEIFNDILIEFEELKVLGSEAL